MNNRWLSLRLSLPVHIHAHIHMHLHIHTCIHIHIHVYFLADLCTDQQTDNTTTLAGNLAQNPPESLGPGVSCRPQATSLPRTPPQILTRVQGLCGTQNCRQAFKGGCIGEYPQWPQLWHGILMSRNRNPSWQVLGFQTVWRAVSRAYRDVVGSDAGFEHR